MALESHTKVVGSERWTAHNREVIKRFAELAQQENVHLLISGSLAYGPDYSVREKSDVDSILTADLSSLGVVVEKLIASGIYPSEIAQRFENFRRLYMEGRAHTFSVRCRIGDTDIGTDFVPWGVAERICRLELLDSRTYAGKKGEISIRIVHEFRPALPSREDGYSMDDLQGSRSFAFHPQYQICKDSAGVTFGYLYETPVDARAKDGTYFIGLLSFYFSVHPIVVLDPGGRLESLLKSFKGEIATTLKGEVPTYITRQERMDPVILQKIKDDFTASK